MWKTTALFVQIIGKWDQKLIKCLLTKNSAKNEVLYFSSNFTENTPLDRIIFLIFNCIRILKVWLSLWLISSKINFSWFFEDQKLPFHTVILNNSHWRNFWSFWWKFREIVQHWEILPMGEKSMQDFFLQNYTVKLSNLKIILVCFDGKIELFSTSVWNAFS